MSDDSTIIGRGREVLLPPQGNPFKKGGSGEEPKDLSPTEIAARFGGTTPAALAGESVNEPTDLQPEDIAALFPSSHDERNVIPGAAAEAASPSAVADLSPADIAAMFPAPAETTPPPARIDIAAFNPDATIGQPKTPDISSTTMMADAASTSPVPGAPSATAAPTLSVGFKPHDPFAPSADKPKPAAEPAPVFGVVNPFAHDSPDDIDDETTTKVAKAEYAVPPVPEDETLVEKLITDQRVEELWQRIEAAEKMAVADENSLPSQRVANFENLKAARNLLLGGRKNYEDALRYVVEVESDLLYVGRVRRWSYTWGMFILFYNLVWLALLTLGYASATRVASLFATTGVFDKAFGFTLWITILSGGLGGVSKSLFSLASHVSRQDFDSQHRMWYFTSPLIGAVLGIFVVLISQVGLVAVSAGGGNTGNAGLIVYIMAWVVGFQQNIALKLVEQVTKLLVKSDEGKETPVQPSLPDVTGDSK